MNCYGRDLISRMSNIQMLYFANWIIVYVLRVQGMRTVRDRKLFESCSSSCKTFVKSQFSRVVLDMGKWNMIHILLRRNSQISCGPRVGNYKSLDPQEILEFWESVSTSPWTHKKSMQFWKNMKVVERMDACVLDPMIDSCSTFFCCTRLSRWQWRERRFGMRECKSIVWFWITRNRGLHQKWCNIGIFKGCDICQADIRNFSIWKRGTETNDPPFSLYLHLPYCLPGFFMVQITWYKYSFDLFGANGRFLGIQNLWISRFVPFLTKQGKRTSYNGTVFASGYWILFNNDCRLDLCNWSVFSQWCPFGHWVVDEDSSAAARCSSGHN